MEEKIIVKLLDLVEGISDEMLLALLYVITNEMIDRKIAKEKIKVGD